MVGNHVGWKVELKPMLFAVGFIFLFTVGGSHRDDSCKLWG